MSMDEARNHRHFKRALLCIVLSILVHIITVICLLLLPKHGPAKSRGTGPHGGEQEPPPQRLIRMHRTPPAPQETPPFAKTSPDEEQQKPDTVDFEGKHNTRASGDETAPKRQNEAPLPTMQGEEKEEVVTFDQKRQEGDLEHEGKRDTAPAPPHPVEELIPLPDSPAPPPGMGSPDNTDNHQTNLGDGQNSNTPEATHTATIPTPSPDGDTLLQTRQDEAEKKLTPSPPSARRGLRDISALSPHQPSRPHRRRVTVRDPSLAAPTQAPGFRTQERRSRSTGRFVMGRKPSLNVAATPRGRYESEIYRRIARIWYAACDEHRGDVIPGSVTISLRIDKRGHLRNMQLLSRHGASVIQQSFTLGAIRRATLPPMPPNVSADVVGDVMELIIEFNFD